MDQDNSQQILKAIETLGQDVHGINEAVQSLADHIDDRFKSVFTKTELLDVFDDKLGSMKGDIIHVTRQEDKKVLALVNTLRKKEILTDEEAKQIFAMEPFPNSI